MSGTPSSIETRVPPLVLLLMAAVICWVLSDAGPQLDGWGWIVAGVAFAVGGLATMVTGVRQFGRHQTTVNPHKIDDASSLVTDGIYRYTRNPMYLGMALVLIGIGLVLAGPVAVVISLAFFVITIVNLQIRAEERMMGNLFGDAYDAYCDDVRRWL